MAVLTSGFSKNQPSGSSSIRDGDDLLRSDKSIFENVLNDEHYFTPQTSASSASGGVHRKGSARVFTNATRASLTTPSSADSNGRLAYCDDLQSLHLIGTSSNTTIHWGCDPPGAQLYSATTNVTSGTTTTVIGMTEKFDVGGFTTNSVSTFVVPSGFSGRYMVTANAWFGSSVTVAHRRLGIKIGNLDHFAFAGSNATGIAFLTASGIVQASESTLITLDVFHDVGVTHSLNSLFFTIQRI